MTLLLSLTAGINLPSLQAEAPYLSESEVRALICQPQYLWDCETMVNTAYRESKYNSEAINYDCWPGHYIYGRPYICYGLLQLIERPDTLQSDINVSESYKLWLASRNDPWGN